MKKVMLIILSWLLTGSLFSQDYQWKTEVEQVDSSGFYKIDLQPEIVTKLNVNFTDIRIKDKEEKEIPYFIEKEPFSVTKRVFKKYEIIEKIRWRNGATVLVVENKLKDTINNIQLQIKNFDVRKHLELAASDDYRNWYTIKENYLFYSADGSNQTSEVKSLCFPYTDYQYYRIIIYDCYSLPINVLKIGYFDTYQEEGKFKALDSPVVSRWDSALTKQTYLKVSFKDTPYFDKLTFNIDKPAYFYRKAKIALKRVDKKGRVYYESIAYLTLNTNTDLTFYQSDFPYQEFYVIIENEDNPPLEGVKLKAFQLHRHLIAHLENDNQYQLVFSSEQMKDKPVYDIEYFKNRINEDIPVLDTGNIQPILQGKKKKITTSTLWIWGTIGGVALLLAYLSYKMITEMEKKS